MKMNMERILSKVPEYTEFYTVEEMNKRSFDLAAKYPEVVEVTELGKSKMGRSIYCLKIGTGSKKALWYGTPHPNEPIGTMMLDAFTMILAEDEELRNGMDYTWYIVKSSDVDGMAKNEGWFKGPFTITNYQHNFFRPAFDQQVEWSFPMNYKKYKFDTPTPETQCLMRLIDEVKPNFIYGLHNCGFGGCYWYLTHGDDNLYKELLKVPAKYKIDLNLGEPETPYCELRADAVYTMIGSTDNYDYMEKYIPDQPTEQLMRGGSCSYEYATRDGNQKVAMLVTEMPYYMDPRVSDMSLSDKTRGEVVLEGCKLTMKDFDFWKPIYDDIARYMHQDNQFFLASKERSGSGSDFVAKENWVKADTSMKEKATVCQVFDNLLSNRFYSNLGIVLLRRACDDELAREGICKETASILKEAREKLYEKECQNLASLEAELNYSVVPISHLVKVQLECGLLYAQYAASLQ